MLDVESNRAIHEAIIDVMHSEHCSYRSTRRDLARLPTLGEYVIQGPGENAGIVRLGQGLALALRIESHNHPSAVVPFDGAATGVGGIIRDIFTMGARPIALVDMLRFGTDIRSTYLMREVVRGIGDYGNTIGIPIVGGDVYFDASYNGNPLVNVACMGLVKEKNIVYGNALTPGSDLIYVGGRTGMDGIHGASFASKDTVEIKEGEEVNKRSIQKGDPFLEKLLVEACVELSETDWIEGMQDMGAAGILCSTSEVVHRGHKKTDLPLGARVDLDLVPLKVPIMAPEHILISESQERMMIVGKRPFREKILEIFRKWDLEARVIGEVTTDENYTVNFSDDGIKKEFSMPLSEITGDIFSDHPSTKAKPIGGEYRKASKSTTQEIWRQYDWRVGARTINGPNEPGHYAILDIDEIGKELVISWSSDEGRSDVDARLGVQHAFDRAYHYMRVNNAEALGLTNCLNFGNPERGMGAFSETIDGLVSRCNEFGVPVISGNVSLYNDVDGRPVKPTPNLVMVGIRNKG